MRRFSALRVRFALWTAGFILLALAAFGAYVYASMARGLAKAVDDALSLAAAQIAADFDTTPNGVLILREVLGVEPEGMALSRAGFSVRILSPQGEVLQAFGPHHSLLPVPQPVPAEPAFSTLRDPATDTEVRLYTLPVAVASQPRPIVQVAHSLAERQATLQRLLRTLLVGVPLLVIVAGWGGYVLAARALAPVDRITHTAERIAAGTDNLSARLNLPPTDDEVGRLARTFDGMLARLDEAFRRERQFTADASHELRTPLTAMQAILSLVRDKPRTPEEYQEALGDLDYEAGRLRALTEALLRLARSEAPDAAPHEAIDLSALLTDLADSLRPVAAAKSLSLDCAVAAGLIVCGDRDDLIRLFANLIDNAVKFTERGGLCLEADRAHHDAVRVLIADTGPGIAADHLPRIFDRFYRADPSRSAPGAGLGLSIAAAIARAHAGRIEVSSAVGQGTRFTVVLPSAARGGLR